MNRRPGRCEPDGLAAVLRREAAGGRPRFSESLHARLLRRLPVDQSAAAVTEAPRPRLADARGRAWSWFGVMAGVAAMAAVAIVILRSGPDPAQGQPRTGGVVETDLAGTSLVVAGDLDVGIDAVPMFDELEAGVREGVSTLAATLLDVPEWRMLADFDTAGFLGADAGR